MILRQRFLNCIGYCLLVLCRCNTSHRRRDQHRDCDSARRRHAGNQWRSPHAIGNAAPDPLTAHGWSSQLYLKVAIATAGPVSCRKKAPDRWQCQTAEGSDLGSLLIQTGQARAADPYY